MEQNIKRSENRIKIRKEKKEISLNRFFITFLAHAILSLICTGFLWGCLLYAITFFHIIIPANAVEHSVAAWCGTLDGHTAITPDEIPDGAGYAFFDTDGILLLSNLETDARNAAAQLAASGNQTNIRRDGTSIYLKLNTDTQCVIVAYKLAASFAFPALQRLFPNAERFLFMLLFLLLISDFVLISIRYAHRLNRELQKLAVAAEQIGRQNLVFEVQKTKLAEFNQIMDSLEQLKTSLQRSLKEQWAIEQSKKRQLTALAHDIKTPLAVVSGNAQLLSETPQSEEQKEYTAFILEHTAQIYRYVTGMMELSKAGNASDASGIFSGIRQLLTAAAQKIESLGIKKRLTCSLAVEELPDTLFVPEEKVQRILDNLIDNAVQYSPENGTVFLCARIADPALQIWIRDEGNGFSKEALSNAAVEFYRADQSRNSKEHFGLGLAIAKQLAEGLGGTLRLENAPQKGALVTVCIPLVSCTFAHNGSQPSS